MVEHILGKNEIQVQFLVGAPVYKYLMEKYFLELLDFKYPKAELLVYQDSINQWKPNVHYNKLGIDTSKDSKWFDFYADINEPLIKEISNNINLTLENRPYKFVKTLAGGSLPFHIDPQRECVLMLPLTDNNAVLQWKDTDDNILCECTYKGPTVINAKILHGVPTIEKDRIFLQVNVPCSWDYLLKNYKNIFNLLTKMC